jgi:hypothetical protein
MDADQRFPGLLTYNLFHSTPVITFDIFQVILDGISFALKIVGKVHDPLVGAIDELSTEYSLMFRKAFGMKSKSQGK